MATIRRRTLDLETKKEKQWVLLLLTVFVSFLSSVVIFMMVKSAFNISAWWGVVYFLIFIALGYYLIYHRKEAFWSVFLEAFLPYVMLNGLPIGLYWQWLREDMGIQEIQAILGSVSLAVLASAVVGILYLYLFDIKYWHKVKDINLRYKINLKKGTFKLGQTWAGTYQYTDGNSHWLKAIPVLGASVGVGILSFFPVENAMLFISCIVLSSLSGIYGAHKLHYLYRVLQFERQIGKRLIIE